MTPAQLFIRSQWPQTSDHRNTDGTIFNHLVNASITQSEVPSSWKHSLVLPIFKSGDHTQPSNYRPISNCPSDRQNSRACSPPAALLLSLIQPPPFLIPAGFPYSPLYRDRADHHFRTHPIRQRPWRNIAALHSRSQQVFRCDRPRKIPQQTARP